jgi:hypothetical protein
MALLISGATAPSVININTTVTAQPSALPVIKANFAAYAAFIVIHPYLPADTELTSSYRSPEDQLRVIREMALKNGIPVPPIMKVDDPSTWEGVVAALRSKKIQIAYPEKTPHGSDKLIVIDLSGADLDRIAAGCRTAQSKGLIVITNILVEKNNNAVHVALEVTISGMRMLENPKQISNSTPAENVSNQPPPSQAPTTADEDQKKFLQELKRQHDSILDPDKRIDYDRLRIKFLDTVLDAEQIKHLEEEIEKHKQEKAENLANTERQNAIQDVTLKSEMGNLGEAKQATERFLKKFPDYPEADTALTQMTFALLIEQAIAAMVQSRCSECEKANQFIDSALKTMPDDQKALMLKTEIDACLSRCKTRKVFYLSLISLLAVGLVLGGYFLLKPKKWALEGIQGQCKGVVFPLDKNKIVIGALGPPDGEADIIISDSRRKISRLHCLIVQNGRHLYLSDRSNNGTRVNDKEVEREDYVKLHDGDEISIADEAVLVLKHQ